MHRTKIVATLGPATSTPESISALLDAGMNIARLNFSHGSAEDHRRSVALVRQAAAERGCPVGILQDLQGPKMRTGPLLDDKPLPLVAGHSLTITTDPVVGSEGLISTDYQHLPADVSPGDEILMSDGLLALKVTACDERSVRTTVVRGGMLRSRQGINLPGVRVSSPSVTEKDLEDLALGTELGVDYVAISFVRQAADVQRVRQALAAAGANTPIIAKLERPEALEDLDAIIAAADGLMVARGDLGVEMAPELVPGLQKQIIHAANRAGKPVITATQMLESMVGSPQPTRAEVSDVANAILDGSDAIMLSGETAIGKYPVRAVEMMHRIAEAVEEQAIRQAEAAIGYPLNEWSSIPEGIAAAVSALVRTLPVGAICVVTRSGDTARLVSRYRPAQPILAFTPVESTYRRLCLLWGVTPILTEYAHTEQRYYEQIRRILLDNQYVQPNAKVVITGGHPVTTGGPTNMINVISLDALG
ncbi:MAG: pyruvate kinase [Anaerolineae bacterium]|jgi:pyruvate kinase|nr:pyruvate kinase [Chloroflexota bacterium]